MMTTLYQRLIKHALRCPQCAEHPDNLCPAGALIASAAASAAAIEFIRDGKRPGNTSSEPEPAPASTAQSNVVVSFTTCAMCSQTVLPGDWLCLDHRSWLNQEHRREWMLLNDIPRT